MHPDAREVMQQASKMLRIGGNFTCSPHGTVVAFPGRVRKEVEGKMKKLNVEWLPETFAIVSLAIAKTPSTEVRMPLFGEPPSRLHSRAPGKLIVVSDGRELRAHVATRQ